ncbi:Peroxiredoxin [Pseudonocardia sp. Ae406_Ps2]|uniref:peroxiredoxin n=1 Tax=unclassified Pseudonocardia TaxID=2619320 RepID=UPI0006CB73B8|nr:MULTISPECIES: peroxiredoxin [unclassified Pseudonocardia]ALE83849.1 peroxiredoxin [Pseudonocardia sp. HH130629-09]OLM01497.1 Peroxiredoxin [Pseudonocardia sp. Ae406_Ps2]OLM06701.1 Peroxiredoxin [Pseudonocardia sp. Ae331_Ps2]OLM13455.1 Peroxiredoxin [Pseudonocardia sp. Ae505_Ps2]OLM23068.1 Peroxiredoxin [Pseudonocardia sp. Ae706_Ps2]
MALAAGDQIPDVTLMTPSAEGPKPVQSASVLGTGTVVLFGVPGAFTPACSDTHLPGFVLRRDELKAKGVDTVACTSVNDAFVLEAWAESRGAGDAVLMLADGNGDFAKTAGLDMDGSSFGLGTRSKRYAAIVTDGVVRWIGVEDVPSSVDVSGVESVLAQL